MAYTTDSAANYSFGEVKEKLSVGSSSLFMMIQDGQLHPFVPFKGHVKKIRYMKFSDELGEYKYSDENDVKITGFHNVTKDECYAVSHGHYRRMMLEEINPETDINVFVYGSSAYRKGFYRSLFLSRCIKPTDLILSEALSFAEVDFLFDKSEVDQLQIELQKKTVSEEIHIDTVCSHKDDKKNISAVKGGEKSGESRGGNILRPLGDFAMSLLDKDPSLTNKELYNYTLKHPDASRNDFKIASLKAHIRRRAKEYRTNK